MTDPRGHSLKGTIELHVGEHTIRLQATLPPGKVALGAVLPLARQITEAVVDSAVADTKSAGKTVSCRAGCGGCCRQPVPIGRAEARRLFELVDAMPEPRRSIVKARFGEALAQIRKTDLLQRHANLPAANANDRPRRVTEWTMDYFRLKVPCPFLEDESCSIHPERPLVCREYLVTSPASECATLSLNGIQRVPINASVSKAVTEIEQDGGIRDWIPLVMALEWTASHPAETDRRRALDWVRRLQQILGRNEETS